MAITEVRELDLDGLRDFTSTLADGDTGRRTFLVSTNDATHTEPDIIAAGPSPLSLFPGSSTAVLHSIRPTRDRMNAKKWTLVCEYKSVLNQIETSRATDPDPLNRKTVITGQSRTIMMPMRRVLRTVPYKEWSEAGPGALWTLGAAMNSASDPIDPPIDVAFTEWELHCEKNVSVFPSWFFTHQNGVNTAAQNVTIRGATVTIPKGCGKLGNFTFSADQRENGTDFIRISWNVTCRIPRQLFGAETDEFGPWDEERLDEGMRTYNTVSGKWTNVPGNISLPIPFDGSGQPINTTGARIPQSDLWWIAYRPFGDRVDYSAINWV